MTKISSYLLSLFLWLPLATSKTVSGDFRLSGVDSTAVLTTFAVVPDGARVKVNLTASHMYENERFLKLRLYRDVEWPKYLKSYVCVDRIRVAQHTQDISFSHNSQTNKWESGEVSVLIVNTPEGDSARPHYWYVGMDDCSLEQYMQDHKIPDIHYDLQIFNHIAKVGQESLDLTHLSADEMHLARLHSLTLVLSGLVAFLLFMNVMLHAKNNQTIHAALLWVAVAAALDAGSSLCEIIHLQVYASNGIGSYFIDAVAAHLEAICDSLIAMLLLSIGAGWTLPLDAIKVNPNESPVQKLLTDMSKPMGSMARFNMAGKFGLCILALHVFLAQWGRTYDDDFESYHDLEHTPGKILMFLRIILGFLLLAATFQTRLKCSVRQLQPFYVKLAILGFAWFQSLPLLTLFCNTLVPYYLRHPTVFMGSALLQSSSLMLLAWLVTAHSTAYHQFSHMNATKETDFTDAVSSNPTDEKRTWTFGKTKVRLD